MIFFARFFLWCIFVCGQGHATGGPEVDVEVPAAARLPARGARGLGSDAVGE